VSDHQVSSRLCGTTLMALLSREFRLRQTFERPGHWEHGASPSCPVLFCRQNCEANERRLVNRNGIDVECRDPDPAWHRLQLSLPHRLIYYYYFDPGTQFPGSENYYATQYKNYKKLGSCWHCTAESQLWAVANWPARQKCVVDRAWWLLWYKLVDERRSSETLSTKRRSSLSRSEPDWASAFVELSR